MRPTLRPAAATLVVAAAGLVWTPSPAGAAACTADSGVTVVVDFKQLGGGIDQACVTDQGQADELFAAAGHSLENVQGQAFVCRVDGLPSAEDESCTRTPPANRYWGLWWSDGTDGAWTYASQGAYSLDVPDGGAVAFAWNNTSTAAKPGVAPPDHDQEASPEPSNPKPGGNGGDGGNGGGTTPGGSAESPSSSPTESPSAIDGGDRERSRGGGGDGAKVDGNGKKKADGAEKKRDREDEPTDEPSATSTPEADETPVAAEPPAGAAGDGLPVWVGPSAAGGALAIAGLAAFLRRRAA